MLEAFRKAIGIDFSLESKLIAKPGNNIFRNVAILAASSGVSKIVLLAVTPMLTRLYSPDQFGILAVFSSVVEITFPVLALRYVLAIPLPRTDKMALNLAAVCIAKILFFGCLLTLAGYFFSNSILDVVGGQALASHWFLIVVAITSAALFEVASQWNVRRRNFKQLASAELGQAVAGSLVKLTLGALSAGVHGLLLGQIVQRAAGLAYLGASMVSDARAASPFFSWRHTKLLLAHYKDFPAYRLPSQFLLGFSTQLPIIAAAFLFDEASAGQLSLAFLAIIVPANLIGQTTGKVYYAEIARIGRTRPSEIYAITRAVIYKSAFLGAPLALTLFFVSPTLFSCVFGRDWIYAGTLASYLSILLFSQLISSPTVHALTVIGRNKYYLYINIVRLIIAFCVFFFGYALGISLQLIIAIYSIALSTHYVFVMVVVLRTIRLIEGTRQQ